MYINSVDSTRILKITNIWFEFFIKIFFIKNIVKIAGSKINVIGDFCVIIYTHSNVNIKFNILLLIALVVNFVLELLIATSFNCFQIFLKKIPNKISEYKIVIIHKVMK